MNEGLIQRWNSCVSPEDTVYHLGDFAMGQRSNIQFRKRLNGAVILIRGNHDRSASIMRDEAGFDEVHNNLLLELDGYKLHLAHIPQGVFDPTRRKYDPKLLAPVSADADLFLCGHVHQQWRRMGSLINVGCDVWDYYPRTLAELMEASDG